jgi:hypothetical protein
MPSAVDDLEDQSDWENGLMIGNGPYKLADPRDDQHIVVERNEEWVGDFENDRAKLDRIDFVISQDVESAYNAFEAGDGDTASLVPGRVAEADENSTPRTSARITTRSSGPIRPSVARRTSSSARRCRRPSTATPSTRPSTTAPGPTPPGSPPKASPASSPTCATTARTTRRRPRRPSISGRARATRSTSPSRSS